MLPAIRLKNFRLEQKLNPEWSPNPQFWILKEEVSFPIAPFMLAFKHVTSPTNTRSIIATLLPGVGAGNSLPIISDHTQGKASQTELSFMLANLNAIPFDFVARQKIQGQNLNWFIIEQLPVVPLNDSKTVCFGSKTAEEIINEAVLELVYTAHDMAPFAHDMCYIGEDGDVNPPFIWDENRRLHLFAKLDAVFFHLYGITDRDDVRYVFSMFPIIEKQEKDNYGTYKSCELCLAYMNALESGNPDAEIVL